MIPILGGDSGKIVSSFESQKVHMISKKASDNEYNSYRELGQREQGDHHPSKATTNRRWTVKEEVILKPQLLKIR